MRKIQISLRDEQTTALREMAKDKCQRPSDLIRSGVDIVLEKARAGTDDWRAELLAVAGA